MGDLMEEEISRAEDIGIFLDWRQKNHNETDKRTMEKKAKITRTVFVSEWTSPQGGQVYYHSIELDNGDSGQIGSKEKMPAKLNPGSELTYTIEETSRGNKIKAIVPTTQLKSGGRPQVEPRIQMISFTVSYIKDLVVADKVKMDEFEKQFNRIYALMISKL